MFVLSLSCNTTRMTEDRARPSPQKASLSPHLHIDFWSMILQTFRREGYIIISKHTGKPLETPGLYDAIRVIYANTTSPTLKSYQARRVLVNLMAVNYIHFQGHFHLFDGSSGSFLAELSNATQREVNSDLPPSLGPVDGVWVVKESDRKSIWVAVPGPLGLQPSRT